MGGTYRAWNDNIRRWPPPNGWYRADDGRWWAPGTGPNPPGRRPPLHPPSPTLRRDPSSRSTGLLGGTGSGGGTGGGGGGTGGGLNGDSIGIGTSTDDRPAFAARTSDTALLPLTASHTLAPVALPRRPRLITRLAVVLAGVAMGLLTGAGVIGVLVNAGRIDELPGIPINRPVETASIPTTDGAPIEPWTFERTTVTTLGVVSESRTAGEPTHRTVRFGDLLRIDEIANGPGPEDDVRSGLAG